MGGIEAGAQLSIEARERDDVKAGVKNPYIDITD